MNRRMIGNINNITTQATMEDSSWKNVSVPDNSSLIANNNANSLGGDGATSFSQNSIAYNTGNSSYTSGGQSSPAPGQALGFPNSNTPGSNTPQYTSSPAPSGSSTPGPIVSQNIVTNYVQSSNPANFNGSIGGSFGAPSPLNSFHRPTSSGTPITNTQAGHFSTQNVYGNQFNPLPPAAPFVQSAQQMDRIDPNMRRHNSYFSHTEHRVFELNKRLQQRNEESDNCWWDSFTTEFFEDDSRLTILFCLEDGPKRYTIGRTLIPRFFRSIFEGGVSDLNFQLKHAKESFHNTSITLDCDQCMVQTQHGKPSFTTVCADARLILEFMYDDYMRIKSWHMTIKGHRELIPRSIIGTTPPDPMHFDQISKNITRAGITNSTLNYLRLCVILEPMQELMSRHKAYALSPRDCLKTTLFQKWQRMVAPPGKKDTQRPANKRRKRKGSNSGATNNANAISINNQKRSPSSTNFSLSSQDVMVVGEPTLMGGEFGEEDERLITRLENTQYDGNTSVENENTSGYVHSGSPISSINTWTVERSGGLPSSPGNGLASQNNTSVVDIGKKSPIISQ